MHKLKVGMIEVSHWHARMYINSLKKLGVGVVAVSDKNPEIAAKVKDELHCQRYYTDYREMIEKEKLEFVFAFGRHCEMPFIAERLIKENVGFMMEKPAAVDSPKIKKLADLAEKKKVFVAIALVGRITPMVTQLAKWRDKAELGDFTHLCMRYIAGSPDRYIKGNSEWMLDKKQAGGGCTINLAVHFVDMFIYLTGKKVKSVFAKMSSLVHNKGIEDSSSIVLASEDSTIGTIETGYTRPTVQAEYCAFCTTKSYITSVGLFESGIMEREDREGQKIEIKCHSQNNVYFEFIKSTLNSFRSGDKPIANLKDMYEVMRVVDMAYESNLKNKVMILEE